MDIEKLVDIRLAFKPECLDRCPKICSDLSELVMLSYQHAQATANGEAYLATEETFREQISDQVSPDAADRINKGVRQTLVDGMDKIDDRSASVRQQMQQDSAGCAGPLAMRASKAGTTYTATICTAPSAYPNTPTHTSAHVRADQTQPGPKQ